jgi:CsgH protein
MAPVDHPPAIVCSIVQQELGDRLQLRGRVIGTQKTEGNFSLRVVKTGPSGSSTIAQSGTFSTPANAETLLSYASFNMERGARFTAELRLQVGEQTYSCQSTETRDER